MSKRINFLEESPCYQCHCEMQCDERIKKNPALDIIRDNIFPDADFDFHDCGIWIALNAPEMIEVDEW